MQDTPKQHWEAVYTTKPTDRVSWYRPHIDRSLQFIEGASLPKDFAKVGDAEEVHQTPWGSDQEFVYCYCRMP